MKTVAIFDAENYEKEWNVFAREAVRAIIISNGKIALVKSQKEGYYKFPGGGINQNETHADALIRETSEETGLNINPHSIKEFGMTFEKRKSILHVDEIFEQKSYYYIANVDGNVKEQCLDGYEADLGFILEWVDIETAYNINSIIGKKYDTSFVLREAYVLNLIKDKLKEKNDIIAQNKTSWDEIADSFFGITALPTYGCLCPTENELHLFPDLHGKKVLDIGCGSGHSLKWCGDNGADELWGLDLSIKQIENATGFLVENRFAPKLYNSPMEKNPGLPQNYFDVVYSIYAIGWTVDIEATFNLIASYLKKDGVFIFSWDHPFMHCVEASEDKLIFSGSYYEKEPFTFKKDVKKPANRNNPDLDKESGFPMTLYNRRLGDYINALSKAGLMVEQLVEEADIDTLNRDCEFTSRYYSA